MSWNRKHLLDIQSLTAEEIITVLDTARAFKAVGERAIKKVPALRGKTVVNLFVEPSTRTRISFELAAQRLTADIINFTAEASSLKKGRDAQGHGAQSGGAQRRHHRHPPQRHGRAAFPGPVAATPASSTPATAPTSIPPRPCWTPSPSARRKAGSRG